MNIDFPIAFWKMSGTGNDFIIIDHRQPIVPVELQQDFVARVCRRRFSTGADGLIFIEDSQTADFSWRFYNGDGSSAEMCGNGARCAARFAYKNGIAPKKMSFNTIAGVVHAEIVDDRENVSLLMTDPFDFRMDLSADIDSERMSFSFVNTGVPHVVIFVEQEDIPIKNWGSKIRFHQMFQPAGTNVNFVRKIRGNRLHVRTYERGVEDETMACGTGAVASAIIGSLQGVVASPVEVLTSGGDELTIVFNLAENTSATDVYLQGPAHIIYTGVLTPESLL